MKRPDSLDRHVYTLQIEVWPEKDKLPMVVDSTLMDVYATFRAAVEAAQEEWRQCCSPARELTDGCLTTFCISKMPVLNRHTDLTDVRWTPGEHWRWNPDGDQDAAPDFDPNCPRPELW